MYSANQINKSIKEIVEDHCADCGFECGIYGIDVNCDEVDCSYYIVRHILQEKLEKMEREENE